MEKVTLYTKLGCHLCEEAYQVLLDVSFDIPLEIDVVDISHDHNQALSALYFDRIPVVACANASTELAWPFSREDLLGYLSGGIERH